MVVLVDGINSCYFPHQQGLQKKHKAFDMDYSVHQERVSDIKRQGEALIEAVSIFHVLLTVL